MPEMQNLLISLGADAKGETAMTQSDKDLIAELRGHANDPMWAAHAEVRKSILRKAADRLEVLLVAIDKIEDTVSLTFDGPRADCTLKEFCAVD
jgi:hypothetical protein